MVVEEHPADPAAGAAELPEKVHDYRILGLLGRGGFADVYLAAKPGSLRPLALKVLREQTDERVREQILSRFHTEEAIARAIAHPAIVKIRATSPPGVSPAFIAMEYVEGLPFCEYFRRRPEDAELTEVARIAHQVAVAMAAAHELGIVHRDLKPDNVLVTRGSPDDGGGRVKILDFGIAKAPLALFAAPHERAITRYVTELGTVMGSPPYMAPEQNGAAHAVTGKADVFALGIMLLLVVCRADERELIGSSYPLLQPEHVAALLARRPELPAPWGALLGELLAFDPQRRPDMYQAARRLQRLAQPNLALAAAVEAWLERGVIPSKRQLRHLLDGVGTTTELTLDEQRFLRAAPASRLGERRWWPAVAAGGATLAATGVLIAASTSRFAAAPMPAAVAALSPMNAAVAPGARELGTPAPDCRAVVATNSPAPAPPPGLAAAERLVTECRGELAGVRRARDAAKAELAILEARMADLEVDAATEAAASESLTRDLARARESAAEQGKQAFSCRQELEGKARQLTETTERWRSCARGLRAPTTATVIPPSAGTTAEPPSTPPPPAPPPES